MVFTLRCPSVGCRKYMLIEESDRGRRLNCLVCKQPFDIPALTPPETPPRLIPTSHDRSSQTIPVAKRLPPSTDAG